MTVAGVILAAGGGSRFGRPKALVQFRGATLLQRCAQTLAEAGCDPVVVVVGAEAPTIVSGARGVTGCVVVNPHWEGGVATSLRAGLAALTSDDVQAAVVALVDQPLVTPAVVQRLIAAWRAGAPAAAASYGGAVRNPVLLGRDIWSEVLSAAHDDEGARVWLRANPERVSAVACDDVGAPDDIDTRADLRRLAAGSPS